MIAFDMDGTILNVPDSLQVIRDGKELAAALYVPDSLIRYLDYLCNKGIKIGINSARSFENVIGPLTLNKIFPHKEYPHFVISNQQDIHLREGNAFKPLHEWNRQFGKKKDHGCETMRYVSEWAGRFREKYQCRESNNSILCFSESQAKKLSEEIRGIIAEMQLPLDIYREVNRIAVIEKNRCKGAALLHTAELFGLKAENVLAIGDSENDITMIDGRYGFRSATPSNAPYYIKEMILKNKGYVAKASHGNGSAEILEKVFSFPSPIKNAKVSSPDNTVCLQGEIRDKSTGIKIAAKVIIRDSKGKYVSPYIVADNKLHHREFSGHKSWYDGSFKVKVPPGKTAVEISCGLEYKPVARTITLKRGENKKISVELDRRVNMSESNWYCGDIHAHSIHGNRELESDISSAAVAARAEGMDFIALTGDTTRRWDSDWKIYSASKLSGKCKSLSSKKFICSWGQEIKFGRSFSHYLRIGAKDLLWYDDAIYAVADSTRQQNGIIVATHPCEPLDRFCAKDLWLNLYVGAIDAFDIMTGGSSPWLNGAVWHDPFSISLELWFRILNKGYRLPAIGCTDTLFDCYTGGEHFGNVRTYVNIQNFDMDGILDGIKKGRTFVSNGPLVTFSIDGKTQGDEIKADGQKKKVRIDVSLVNVGDWKCKDGYISKIELIRNGKTVKSTSPGNSEISIEWEIKEKEGCWYAVRCFGPCPDIVAVTSPIYFSGRNLKEPAKIGSVKLEGSLEDAVTGKRIQGDIEVWYEGRLFKKITAKAGKFKFEVPPLARLKVTAPGYVADEYSPLDDERLRNYINGLDVWKFADDPVEGKIKEMLSEVQTVSCKLMPE